MRIQSFRYWLRQMTSTSTSTSCWKEGNSCLNLRNRWPFFTDVTVKPISVSISFRSVHTLDDERRKFTARGVKREFAPNVLGDQGVDHIPRSDIERKEREVE